MKPKSPQETIDFSQFLEWAHFYDLHMPVEGEAVAAYLITLMHDGNKLEDIKRVAESIASSYKRRRCFLDLLPVEAALEMCEAQLSPGRVLN